MTIETVFVAVARVMGIGRSVIRLFSARAGRNTAVLATFTIKHINVSDLRFHISTLVSPSKLSNIKNFPEIV
jgi:hypothetical protein